MFPKPMRRYKYILEREVPNNFVRKELRKNMTNLPTRWVGVAVSDDFKELKRIKQSGERIIDGFGNTIS